MSLYFFLFNPFVHSAYPLKLHQVRFHVHDYPNSDSSIHIFNTRFVCSDLKTRFIHSFLQIFRFWDNRLIQRKPRLLCGCLTTRSLATLLDLVSPSKYGHMSMLIINENSDGILNGDQREAEFGLLYSVFPWTTSIDLRCSLASRNLTLRDKQHGKNVICVYSKPSKVLPCRRPARLTTITSVTGRSELVIKPYDKQATQW